MGLDIALDKNQDLHTFVMLVTRRKEHVWSFSCTTILVDSLTGFAVITPTVENVRMTNISGYLPTFIGSSLVVHI
jgi:hypothetical protein